MFKFFTKEVEKIVFKEVYPKYSADELAEMLAAELGDTDSLTLTTGETEKIYAELANIDGLSELLRDTMIQDVRRYFGASDDNERNLIRGSFARTSYWRSKINNKRE
jgi:hypothetical protein